MQNDIVEKRRQEMLRFSYDKIIYFYGTLNTAIFRFSLLKYDITNLSFLISHEKTL